jgi:formylmethanofuran dehydrogenase subunit E
MIEAEMICRRCESPFNESDFSDIDHQVCAECVYSDWQDGEADLPDERE